MQEGEFRTIILSKLSNPKRTIGQSVKAADRPLFIMTSAIGVGHEKRGLGHEETTQSCEWFINTGRKYHVCPSGCGRGGFHTVNCLNFSPMRIVHNKL